MCMFNAHIQVLFLQDLLFKKKKLLTSYSFAP